MYTRYYIVTYYTVVARRYLFVLFRLCDSFFANNADTPGARGAQLEYSLNAGRELPSGNQLESTANRKSSGRSVLQAGFNEAATRRRGKHCNFRFLTNIMRVK